MSKSRGNVVDPMVMKEKYSPEAFRYLLLREGVPHNDGSRFIYIFLTFIAFITFIFLLKKKYLTLLHSEQPNLYGILAFLGAIVSLQGGQGREKSGNRVINQGSLEKTKKSGTTTFRKNNS